MPPRKKSPSLMRALGEIVGAIITPVKDPKPPAAERRTVRRDVEEHTEDTAQGRVTLRRTVVEEVIVESSPQTVGDAPPPPPPTP